MAGRDPAIHHCDGRFALCGGPGYVTFDVTAARGRLHRHAAGARHQERLQRHGFVGAGRIGLGAHADHAVAQAPRQRAERLPFEAIDRIAGRMRLRDQGAGEALAALSSWQMAQLRLSWPWRRVEQGAAGGDERRQRRIVADRDGGAARLAAHIGGQRQEFAALVGERRRLLMGFAAVIDALFEVDRLAARRVEGRIAGGDALHAGLGLAVAVGAALAGRARLGRPQRLAVIDPQRRRIGHVVVLHRAGLRGSCRHRRSGADRQQRRRWRRTQAL